MKKATFILIIALVSCTIFATAQNDRKKDLETKIEFCKKAINQDVLKVRNLTGQVTQLLRKHNLKYKKDYSQAELKEMGADKNSYLELQNKIAAINADELNKSDKIKQYTEQLKTIKKESR